MHKEQPCNHCFINLLSGKYDKVLRQYMYKPTYIESQCDKVHFCDQSALHVSAFFFHARTDTPTAAPFGFLPEDPSLRLAIYLTLPGFPIGNPAKKKWVSVTIFGCPKPSNFEP